MALPAFINPVTLQGASILARLGQGFFANKDLERAKERFDKESARANLINTFGGQARAPQLDIIPGRATSLLGGVGTALDAASGLQTLASGLRRQGMQDEVAELALGQARQQAEGRAGQAAQAAGGQVGIQVDEAPLTREAANRFNAGTISADSDDLSRSRSFLSNIGDAAPLLSPSFQAGAAQQARAEGREAFDMQNTLRRLEQTDRQLAQADERIGLQRQQLEDNKIVRLAQADADRVAAKLKNARSAQEMLGDATDGAHKMATVKKVVEFRNSFNTLQGILTDWAGGAMTGAQQIAAINAFQRLIDPATVREGDVALLRSGQSAWDSFVTRIERIGSGKVVDENLVAQMQATARDMWAAYERSGQDAINAYYAGLSPFMPEDILAASRQQVEGNVFGGELSGLTNEDLLNQLRQ